MEANYFLRYTYRKRSAGFYDKPLTQNLIRTGAPDFCSCSIELLKLPSQFFVEYTSGGRVCRTFKIIRPTQLCIIIIIIIIIIAIVD